MGSTSYCAVAYHLGHDYARKQLRAGNGPDSVRLAMQSAQEHLRELKAYSVGLDAMMRLGVEDALAGKPMDRRYAKVAARRGRGAVRITLKGR
jgi:hypothetical protein